MLLPIITWSFPGIFLCITCILVKEGTGARNQECLDQPQEGSKCTRRAQHEMGSNRQEERKGREDPLFMKGTGVQLSFHRPMQRWIRLLQKQGLVMVCQTSASWVQKAESCC